MLKRYALIVAVLISVMQSCKKGDSITGPQFSLSPTQADAKGGDDIGFDMTVGGVNNLTHLKIDESYNGQSRTLTDSTLSNPKNALDQVYTYHVKDNAVSGDKIALTFTFTDAQGGTAVKTANINITASRPAINVAASKTSAAAGDSISYAITLSSPSKNITMLDVTESIQGQTGTSIYTQSYNNESAVSTHYTYHIPSSLASGSYIALIFTVTDAQGNQRALSRQVVVQ